MKFLLQSLAQGIAVFLTAYVLPGVTVDSFWTAIIVAFLLAIANVIIKPILFVLTLPITILTLGLFTFVLNAIIIMIVDYLVPGFSVGGILNALIFSILLSVIGGVLNAFTKE